MTDYPSGHQYATLADMVRAERSIDAATQRELYAFLAYLILTMQESAETGVVPQINAQQMQDKWDNNHVPEILAVAALAWKKRYKRKRKKKYSDESLDNFLSDAYVTLSFIPNGIFGTVNDTIDSGIRAGLGVNQILDSLYDDLQAHVVLTARRTGRLIGPSLINDATLASYVDLETLDGDGPFVKSWVSVMDSNVRPTHVAAHASPENRKIPLSQKFVVGGYLADRPRDSELPIWESGGCRCIADVTEA